MEIFFRIIPWNEVQNYEETKLANATIRLFNPFV